MNPLAIDVLSDKLDGKKLLNGQGEETMSQELPTLKNENVNAYFDSETGISHIAYTGVLTSSVTSQLYEWVKELMPIIGDNATRAVVFDFRGVTKFAQDNLRTVQRKSKEINRAKDQSDHPVALIVGNMYQEQMVSVTNRLVPGEDRKRIVHSQEEALAYINEWHIKNTAPTDE